MRHLVKYGHWEGYQNNMPDKRFAFDFGYNLPQEQSTMAQAPPPRASNNQQQPMGKSRGGRSGLPWLHVGEMSTEPKRAKIMAYDLPPDPPAGQRKFNDVVLKLYYAGAMYLWGIRYTSPHYENLFTMFGDNFDDWKDKEFNLGQVVREFDQRVFAEVSPVEQPTTRSKRTS